MKQLVPDGDVGLMPGVEGGVVGPDAWSRRRGGRKERVGGKPGEGEGGEWIRK